MHIECVVYRFTEVLSKKLDIYYRINIKLIDIHLVLSIDHAIKTNSYYSAVVNLPSFPSNKSPL